MKLRDLRSVETVDGDTHATISEDRLLFLGGLMGLCPSLRGRNGQPLAKAAEVLLGGPDFAADAEFIERELFVPENPNHN